MDPRMRLRHSGVVIDNHVEESHIDPVARSMMPKTMKISEELLKRAKIKSGGVSIDAGRARCFIGLSDER